jgi:hypothetical protein
VVAGVQPREGAPHGRGNFKAPRSDPGLGKAWVGPDAEVVGPGRRGARTKFFFLFHSKFEMPFNMKVVSLEKLDNFHIGGF